MSNAQDLTIGPGKLRFYHDYRPPLVAGSYEIQVAQDLDLTAIDGDGPETETFSRSQVFHVQASRFRLGAGDLHAVYPPANTQGDFAETVPHVVLRQRGLPWQIDPFEDDEVLRPWLALLLFHGEEAPPTQTLTLGEIAPPDRQRIRRPRIDLTLEDAADQAHVIDVPVDVFRDIAPRPEDLPWLTHVREVNTGAKELLGLAQDGWFSVVLGNRMPGEGENTAHLVSLEGWQDDLDRGFATEVNSVRLVSLASWSFTVDSARGSFRELMQRLDTGPLASPVPESVRSQALAGEGPAQALVDAIDDGFVPLSYDMRQGEHTAAWYRGPLLPTVPKRVQDRGPLASAEAGMVYNAASGMFDVSFAAAWQIGRLLALADSGFASALSGWRQHGQQIVDRLIEREAVARRFRRAELFKSMSDIVSAPEDEQEALLLELLTQTLDPAATRKALGSYLAARLSETTPPQDGGDLPRPGGARKELLHRDIPELTFAELAELRSGDPGLPRAERLRDLIRRKRQEETT